MAAPQLNQGTLLCCMWGMAPAAASPLPAGQPVLASNALAGTMSSQQLPELGPFGMCRSPLHPAVMMTRAPGPCVLGLTGPWLQANLRCMIGGTPTATLLSSCMCSYSMGPNIRPLSGQIKVIT